jgi:hypothetical protein
VDDIDEEQYLSFVGLRPKTKKPSVPIQTLKSLVKRLAAPVCLLPLPKHGERVRQALYILLPFLKFLSFTHDIELFCSTDDKTKFDSLLPRSVTQTRTSTTKTRKRKVSKTGKWNYQCIHEKRRLRRIISFRIFSRYLKKILLTSLDSVQSYPDRFNLSEFGLHTT